jgi:hypothetical protein
MPAGFSCEMPLPEGNIDIVAEGNENPVRFPEAGHPEDVAPNFHPPLPAFEALGDIDRLSGSARRLAECGDLLGADAQQFAEKKRLLAVLGSAEIFLVDERQGADVFKRTDVVRVKLAVQAPIKSAVGLSVGQEAAEIMNLYLLQLLSRKGLDEGVPIRLLG